jgi:NADH dehydrogenase
LTTDAAEKDSLINFVIVGGGPTGRACRCVSRDEKSNSSKDYPDLDIAK